MKDKATNNNINGMNDKRVHRTFQFAALILLAFVVYSIYFETPQETGKNNPYSNLTEEQFQQRVESAFRKMADSPEYKQVKDFVLYVEDNTDEKNAKLLQAKTGVLIYIPQNMLDAGLNNQVLEHGSVKISVSSEEKDTNISRPAENKASQ